jgi:hypothetical protein
LRLGFLRPAGISLSVVLGDTPDDGAFQAALAAALAHLHDDQAIQDRSKPSLLQPQRWSYYVGGRYCGEAATQADALRCAREQADAMQRHDSDVRWPRAHRAPTA